LNVQLVGHTLGVRYPSTSRTCGTRRPLSVPPRIYTPQDSKASNRRDLPSSHRVLPARMLISGAAATSSAARSRADRSDETRLRAQALQEPSAGRPHRDKPPLSAAGPQPSGVRFKEVTKLIESPASRRRAPRSTSDENALRRPVVAVHSGRPRMLSEGRFGRHVRSHPQPAGVEGLRAPDRAALRFRVPWIAWVLSWALWRVRARGRVARRRARRVPGRSARREREAGASAARRGTGARSPLPATRSR
jgi:hypothetical protein